MHQACQTVALEPALKHYEWGDPDFIPGLLGLPSTGQPCAEAWFGAHPLSPAQAQLPAGAQPLCDVVAQHAASLLGARVHANFGALPYLLKLLAAARPLSVQVHPNAQQAALGFAREDALGIPRDAPHRNYRDPHAKPELLVALTPFHALCGWRPKHERIKALALIPEVVSLLEPGAERTPLSRFLHAYFALPAAPLAEAWTTVLERWSNASKVHEAVPWALHAPRDAQGRPDPGLLFVLLLRLVTLRPNEALFLPAGTPHAYLRGAGVELMASSDNVLRAGLTNKHIDPDELMRTVRFDRAAPDILRPTPVSKPGRAGCRWSYPVATSHFALERIVLDRPRRISLVARGPETLLVVPDHQTATVRIETADQVVVLRAGQACLIADGETYTLASEGPAAVFRAGVP